MASAGLGQRKRLERLFVMKASWRIGVALVGAVAAAAAFAVVWPRAHDAAALLLAQDDPAELSDLQLGFALRHREEAIAENITAALDTGDVDLAKSFIDLAKDRRIPLPPGLSERVEAAVVEENSTASLAAAVYDRSGDGASRRCRQSFGNGSGRSVRVRRHS